MFWFSSPITPTLKKMGWLMRFLAVVASLAVGVKFSPEIFESSSDDQKSSTGTAIFKLAHLLGFATAWGAALWVTFIGIVIMFKNVQRRQFGNLQSKMLPAYFTMLAVCCAISVASFGYLHPWKSSSTKEKYQLGFLLSAFAFNLTNLFVFTPVTIKRMKQRHRLEKEDEIGRSKSKEIAKVDSNLAAARKKFGMYHGLSSLANILAFSSLAMHSWYLANKINL